MTMLGILLIVVLGELLDPYNTASYGSKMLEKDPYNLSDSSKWMPSIVLSNYLVSKSIKINIVDSNLSLNYMNSNLDPDGTNGRINTIAVYRTPLRGNSVVEKIVNMTEPGYHAFVYLQVGDRHISLEKLSDGLTIQVSKDRSDVLLKFSGNPRGGVLKIIADKGNMNITDFIEFIVQKQFINEGYNPLTGNHCKRFAQDVFDKAANVKHYEYKSEEMKLKQVFAAIMAVLVVGVAAAVIKVSRVTAGMVETAAGRAATAVTTAAVTVYEASVAVCEKAADSSLIKNLKCILSVLDHSSKWDNKIYVINHVFGIKSIMCIHAGDFCPYELKDTLNYYLDPFGTNATIDTIAVYRTPLEGNSFVVKTINKTKAGYHAFVYLQVKDHYMSLHKHVDGLTICVSKERRDVLHNFRCCSRNGVSEEIVADNGCIKVKELIDFIVQKDFIKEGFNFWKGNHCKKFAKDIFDRVAAVSHYNWE